MPNSTPNNADLFVTAGTAADQIEVKISYRIIQLFSEGLYSSPNKAVEELVSNSFGCNRRCAPTWISQFTYSDELRGLATMIKTRKRAPG